ncbi:MAG: hypothetical protein SGBAC_010991 [Bacillariaceae sp.]
MSSPHITVANKTTSSNNSQEFTTVPIGTDNVDNDSPPTKADSSNNSNNNISNTSNKEKTPNKMMRGTKNAWRRAVGCCKKSTPRTKIRLKEHQITKRKTAFGIQYMDLVQSQASEEELQQAVQACLQDIGGVLQEITELEQKIEQVSEETKSKLKQKPTSSATSQSTGKKPMYENSGLYSGGDPSIEETDEDEIEEGGEEEEGNTTKTPPPQGAFFSIAEGDEDEDNDSYNDDGDADADADLSSPEMESWDIPAPPSTPPPAVPVVESI